MKVLTYLYADCACAFPLGVTANSNTSVYMKITPMEAQNWGGDGFPTFIGVRNTDTISCILFRYNGGGLNRNTINYCNGGSDNSFTNPMQYGTEYEVVMGQTGITFVGIETHSFGGGGDFVDEEMVLNSNKLNQNGRAQSCRYAEVIIYDNGVEIEHLIPVIDENNVVCFYDSVGENYVYNAGNGTPVAGPFASTINVYGPSSSIPSAGGNVNIEVSSETSWTASTSANWITIGTTTGTSATTSTTVTIDVNQTSSSRQGTIEFVNETGDTASFSITQKKYVEQYMFCDKVYNNGTSSIDTGIYPDSATTIDFIIVNENTGSTGYNALYIGNGGFRLETYNDFPEKATFIYGDGYIRNFSLPSGSTLEVNLSNTGITLSNGTYGEIYPTTFTTTGETIKIGGNGCFASFGNVVITKGGNVVADLKPCVLGNDVGFYDSVSKSFFGNSGFTAIDIYGNFILGDGDENIDKINIGNEGVNMIYLGSKPIYANTQTVSPPV